MLCQFLVYSKVIKLHIHIHIYIHTFSYSFPLLFIADMEYSSLCYTLGPYCFTLKCIFFFVDVNFNLFIFWPCFVAYGILVPLPGIEPVSLQWKQKSQSPDHQGSPRTLLFLLTCFNVLLIRV